jgi:hypothetical protein
MRIAPLFSCVLWTVAACGDDPVAFIDAREDDAAASDAAATDAEDIDAPEIDAAVDAPIDAALLPMATLPTTASVGTTCGVSPAPTTDITVGNSGTADLVITAAAATGGFTVVTSFPVTVAPGATATLTIRAPQAVIGTNLAGTTMTGTLTLTSNESGGSPTVALSSPVSGANLALSDVAGSPLTMLAFNAGSGCPASQTVRVTNTGNMVASINNASGSSFLFSGWSPSTTLGPGSSAQHTVSLYTFGPCTGSESVSYSASGSVCTVTPLPLSLTFNVGSGSGCFCS